MQPLPPPPRRAIPWGWLVAFGVLYVLTVVPVGLFVYTLKMDAGIDLFQRGGFHAYLQCLEAATGTTIAPNLKLLPPDTAASPRD